MSEFNDFGDLGVLLEVEEDPNDPTKDPERVIGGYKSQVTTLQHRLDAAKHFLLLEFGIDIGDIDNDGQLVVNSESSRILARNKVMVQEDHRGAIFGQNLQQSLRDLWEDDIQIDPSGRIEWNGLVGSIARVQRNGQQAKVELQAALSSALEKGSRRPGIRESGAQGWTEGTSRAKDRVGSIRIPRVRAEPVDQQGRRSLKDTFTSAAARTSITTDTGGNEVIEIVKPTEDKTTRSLRNAFRKGSGQDSVTSQKEQ